MRNDFLLLSLLGILLCTGLVSADDSKDSPKVDENIGKAQDGSKTDDEVVQREEEAIKLDGLSVAQMKELRDKSEKHVFQAEVDRMMKLIINSLYKNKEIFLRELISNASDALDKIRFLSLTDPSVLGDSKDLTIRIKADMENKVLHITDTGIGMTRKDLVTNLGTIAKSGTSDFLGKLTNAKSTAEASDLIGQFGVGFYSVFLVADRVMVTSKNNDDDQYIWESDSASFSVAKDPRGNTMTRGTTISVFLKEEAHDFLEPNTIENLVTKYSQFINFDIYLWQGGDVKEEVKKEEKKEEKKEGDEDAAVEEETDDDKKTAPATQWKHINDNKPIWTRKSSEVGSDEYEKFYKSFTKDDKAPLSHTHFVAEGEVTFKSILYIPTTGPQDMFSNYGKRKEGIKMYVRRVFITDDFEEMLPKYLSFVKGVVDSDDLPLNVSRETLQQNKLLKVIRKKLVRKTLDMIKKISKEQFDKFWKEYSTNIKLGVMEDHSNRTRLAKLLRFYSSNSATDLTSLEEYVERMKEKQEAIYFVAGSSRAEVEKSPFVESLLKKGFEVLYMVEAVDEYCIQNLPEFDGKKFQNVAKEGLKIDDSEKAKERKEALTKDFEPLTNWLKENALKDKIEKAVVSERLHSSPCALIASTYGWSGNMQRLMKAQTHTKSQDPNQAHYGGAKRTFEINPGHPLIKELKRRSEADAEDKTAKDLAVLLWETATLRSGYELDDTAGFGSRVERMLRLSMNVDPEAKVEEFDTVEDDAAESEEIKADDDETKPEAKTEKTDEAKKDEL